jgi:hypothetical protein
LRPVETVNGTNQFCTTCHRCWRREFGYLVEVNRYACSGCDDRTRCFRYPAPRTEPPSTVPDSTIDELVHLLGW